MRIIYFTVYYTLLTHRCRWKYEKNILRVIQKSQETADAVKEILPIIGYNTNYFIESSCFNIPKGFFGQEGFSDWLKFRCNTQVNVLLIVLFISIYFLLGSALHRYSASHLIGCLVYRGSFIVVKQQHCKCDSPCITCALLLEGGTVCSNGFYVDI